MTHIRFSEVECSYQQEVAQCSKLQLPRARAFVFLLDKPAKKDYEALGMQPSMSSFVFGCLTEATKSRGKPSLSQPGSHGTL